MINQKIEELKEVLAQEGDNNPYGSSVVTVENFFHFVCGEQDVSGVLSKYGIQDLDIFRQTLMRGILDKNIQDQRANNNRNNNQRQEQGANAGRNMMNNYFGNRYNRNDNQAQEQEDDIFVEDGEVEVTLSQQFEEIYKQACIVEYKKNNEAENENQEIQDTDIEDMDPSYDSFLRAIPVYSQIHRRTPALVAVLRDNGFNWQQFLENRNALDEYCINLNQLAKDGKIERVIGREDEILRSAEFLGKKKKGNVILAGKAGVGKTAIAEGLAYKIEREPDSVPHTLANAVVYSLDTSVLVSGASFRGQFEERLKGVLDSLKKLKDDGECEPILFIDEIHTIVGAGGNEGKNDMASALKTHLSKGDIRCIGATTTGEYNKHIKNDHALKRRFSVVKVIEPSREETIEILQGAKGSFEDKHEVEYTDESIVRCVDLAIKHVNETALPDKAIDLMDYCGSKARIECEEEITSTVMEKALARCRRIPLERVVLKEEENVEYQPIAPKLKERVFGQDEALDSICEVIEVSQAGMGESDKPIGSFLLTGPTGVGKTETAKQLADLLGVPMQRIDMSEYMEKHAISKLIGTSAGYVGYQDTPLITKILTDTPHCVLLLDEMEKAHPDIFNVFLQAMDNGMIRDGQQEELSFENVVLVMTSNAGARELQKGSLGLGANNTFKSNSNKEIEKYFSPEFRGRLDGILNFNALPIECMDKIVDKRITQVNKRAGLSRKGITLKLDKKAKDYLIQEGYDVKLGARPLNNKIKVLLEKKVAQELRHGKLRNVTNQEIKVTLKDNKLSLVVPRTKE